MALPTKARPSLSYSQSLPPGSKNYNLQSPEKNKQTKNKQTQSQEATQNDHMDHSLVQLKEDMSHVMQGHPRWTGHGGKFWQNVAYQRREWQTPSVFLTQETHEQFSSVQPQSCVQLFATPWIAARQASLSITNSRSSFRLMSIESVMPSSHLILCHPLFLLPPIPPSIRVFSNESTFRMRWPKYWSFSFSIITSKEIPGLICFRMDWLDLLAVQGTLKSLLQHHSSKASILLRSRNPWTVWKGKKIWHQKMSPPGW